MLSFKPYGFGQPTLKFKPIMVKCVCQNCRATWEEEHEIAQFVNQVYTYETCTNCIHNYPRLLDKYKPTKG
jgi:hypothetical protein